MLYFRNRLFYFLCTSIHTGLVFSTIFVCTLSQHLYFAACEGSADVHFLVRVRQLGERDASELHATARERGRRYAVAASFGAEKETIPKLGARTIFFWQNLI